MFAIIDKLDLNAEHGDSEVSFEERGLLKELEDGGGGMMSGERRKQRGNGRWQNGARV